MLTLEPDSPLPLYYQLEQALKAAISDGRWQPGEMIASERELMRLANVSRATVRQAIGSLIQQGVLERVHGRGTFVARPRFEQKIHTVYSFSEYLRALGLSLKDRILQRKSMPAPPDVAALLGVPIGEKLIHLQRLRLLEGKPLLVESSYIPYELCPDLLTDDLWDSLYRMLTEKYDLPLLRSSDVLECTAADSALAYHLQVPKGTPLMYVERVAYTRSDLPVQVGRNHIRGDMCRFRIDLASEPMAVELKPAAL
jgi:GntR family transcriptional regulator